MTTSPERQRWATAGRLGQKDEQRKAARRVANPAYTEILGDKGVSGLIEGVRQAPEMFESVRQMQPLAR